MIYQTLSIEKATLTDQTKVPVLEYEEVINAIC